MLGLKLIYISNRGPWWLETVLDNFCEDVGFIF